MKQKIIFIASYPNSLVNFRLALMKKFMQAGLEVIAVAPKDAEVEKTLATHNIKYITINMQRNGINPLTDARLIFNLWKIFRKEKPDFIFTYTIKPVIYGSLAAKLAGVPQIYSMITGTGYVFLNVNLKSKIVGFIAQRLFRIALAFNHLVFFQNPDNLDFFRHKKIIARDKAATVINGSGVDCHHFPSTAYPQTISFLMIARFLYDKGIREYVKAAEMLKKKYPHVVCKLVGWIDTNPNSVTEQELDSWIKEGSIHYLGKLEDVRQAITEASVYVLPSYHEGTPRTVLEAMAMARPIITTDAPGCKETVIPNKNGFLVPVKNAEELYQKMEYFILAPEKISEMGQESRQLALDKYDVHKVNESILKAMQLA